LQPRSASMGAQPEAIAAKDVVASQAEDEFEDEPDTESFEVVKSMVFIKNAPNKDAKNLGIVKQGQRVQVRTWRVLDHGGNVWVELTDAQLRRASSSTAGDTDRGYALVDGSRLGFGVLLTGPLPRTSRSETEALEPSPLFSLAFDGLRFGEWFEDRYGDRQRAPCAMLRGTLQPGVLQYLLEAAPFAAEGYDEVMAKHGLVPSEKEFMTLGDWHTLPQWPPEKDVWIPRLAKYGRSLRAPPRVLAFTDAFRKKNESVFGEVLERIERLGQKSHDDDLVALCKHFGAALKEGRHLGIVEVQHRVGPAHNGNPHVDGLTSLLHLAVTLGGRRSLRAKLAPRKDGGKDQEFEHMVKLTAGDVYVSSPSTFNHTVIYEKSDFQDAMVALHMRFLFQVGSMSEHLNNRRDSAMHCVACAVADVLATASLALPNLSEVQKCEARLRARGIR